MRLLAQPRVSIPYAARHEWIVIARDDEHRTRVARALEDREGAGRVGPRDAVIVEDVASDEDEVHAESGGVLTQLLERRESSLPDPVAGVLLEPRDPQAKVEVRGVKEADHPATFLRDGLPPTKCGASASSI